MLTPEQNEQWQKAILGYGTESYLEKWKAVPALAALLPEPSMFRFQSIQPSEERLTALGVPDWANHFRMHCAIRSWADDKDASHWVPEFLLRSEVALVGLTLRHPCHAEKEVAYMRLCVRFVTEALQPFVEHAQKVGWRRRGYYKPVVKLYRFCESYSTMGSALRWPKHLDSLPKRVLREFLSTVEFLLFMLVPLRKGEDTRALPKPHEGFSAHCLSECFLAGVTSILNPDAVTPEDPFNGWSVILIVDFLETQHRWSRDGRKDSDHSYTDLIAGAFLAALEAECPPPDWLPQA
ncbi:MAG: hypothetical protein QM758_06575 [Armatimonas sp.]